MDTGEAAAFLAALQLADAFFPTGMFAHSQGLEGMARRGSATTAADVATWLRNQLIGAVLPSDGVALRHAHRAALHRDGDTIIAIDRLLTAMKLPAELRAASQQGGARMLAEVRALSDDAALAQFQAEVQARRTPGNAAVAFGVACAALGVAESPGLLAYCHSYAVGVLGAALRLLRLTHADAQAILFRLHRDLAAEAARRAERHWTQMTAFTPQTDLAAMAHEADDLRMFAS